MFVGVGGVDVLFHFHTLYVHTYVHTALTDTYVRTYYVCTYVRM